MRIGLNLLYLLPGIVGGTETYASGLLQGLAAADRDNDYLVFVNAESTFWPIPDAPNMYRIVCPVRATNRFQRLAYEQLAMPGLADGHRLDVLHSLGYVAPLRLPCPGVVTIHDMNTKGHGRCMGRGKRLILAFMVRLSAMRSSRVITVSEFSKQEITTHLRLAPDKVTVVHEAPLVADRTADNAGPGAEKPYLLTFASLSPHKNIPRLIQAFALLAPTIPHQLVLAGHVPMDGAIRQAIADQNLTGRVQLTGWLPRKEVEDLLAKADAFVFPSMYEGFGLPVLEAQAQDTMVICSNKGALPEVAGEGAAFFNPESPQDMAETIRLCLFDPVLRQRLRQAGARNLSRFSWTTAACETLAVYELALGRAIRP